jgi:hypothetical protein
MVDFSNSYNEVNFNEGKVRDSRVFYFNEELVKLKKSTIF